MSFILIFSRKVFREPNPTRFKSTKSDAKIISTDFISGPITHIKYSYTAVKNICRCSFLALSQERKNSGYESDEKLSISKVSRSCFCQV